MTDSRCTRFVDSLELLDAEHVAACATCRGSVETLERHRALFGSLAPVEVPAQLREASFLDSIYERASRDAESQFDASAAEVVVELRRQFEAPNRSVEPLDVEPLHSPLRHLKPIPAPGMVWPRVRADVTEWAAECRLERQTGSLRRRRRAHLVAAAAAVVIACWGFYALRVDAALVAESTEIVIVRQRATGPLAPGFSLNAIMREVGTPIAGGVRAR